MKIDNESDEEDQWRRTRGKEDRLVKENQNSVKERGKESR